MNLFCFVGGQNQLQKLQRSDMEFDLQEKLQWIGEVKVLYSLSAKPLKVTYLYKEYNDCIFQ